TTRLLAPFTTSLLRAPVPRFRFATPLLPPRQSLADALLEAERARRVEDRAPQSLREVLLGQVVVLGIERVPVTLPVAEPFHELRRRVPDVQRDRLGWRLPRRGPCLTHRLVEAVRLGRRRQIDRG